jgi:hypothetical protein
MRFTFLAVVCLLALANRGRSEYDAGSTAPAKPAAFNDSAANRPRQNSDVVVYHVGGLTLTHTKRIHTRINTQFAMPVGKVKATHRPANIPSSPYVDPPFACVW